MCRAFLNELALRPDAHCVWEPPTSQTVERVQLAARCYKALKVICVPHVNLLSKKHQQELCRVRAPGLVLLFTCISTNLVQPCLLQKVAAVSVPPHTLETKRRILDTVMKRERVSLPFNLDDLARMPLAAAIDLMQISVCAGKVLSCPTMEESLAGQVLLASSRSEAISLLRKMLQTKSAKQVLADFASANAPDEFFFNMDCPTSLQLHAAVSRLFK